MSGSEYEDFGSGDESWDEEMEETEVEKIQPEDLGENIEDLNHTILSRIETNVLLQEEAKKLQSEIKVSMTVAKTLLMRNKWVLKDAIKSSSEIKLADKLCCSARPGECDVCGSNDEKLLSPYCGHGFCTDCWRYHARTRLMERLDVTCMHQKCPIILTETAIYPLVSGPLGKRLEMVMLDCSVLSHPRLRFCPGADCDKIILALEAPSPRRVTCSGCNYSCCFQCGLEFHLPSDCSIIKSWLKKCCDDSETANYISTNTKDCPRCGSCIEKSGGCNHVTCSQCSYDFCWVCGGPWKEHGAQYYECSKFKETGESQGPNDARQALSKYLHYFQRWDNHCRSLRLEKKFQKKLESIASKEIANRRGSWIDWEHLKDAAKLLALCRYTLKYTYPRAYFMTPSKEKVLFEYQQGVLEAECEDLAYKLEHADNFKIADLEQAKTAAAKSRLNLLKSTSFKLSV